MTTTFGAAMKRASLTAAVVWTSWGLGVANAEEAKTLAVDTEQSAIMWEGNKIVGGHDGTVMLSDGTVKFEGDKLVGGVFTIDFTTITNKDLTDPTDKGKLEGHLKSPDFFNTPAFPNGTFTITKVTPLESSPTIDYTIEGDLEVKGIVHKVTFPAKVSREDGTYRASGSLSIDRTKWDIRYNSAKFFDLKALGEKMILDNIKIGLNIVAKPTA